MQETRPIMAVIKTALKKRKITYSELGKKLGITEAGVKKMFRSGDMPVGRLMAICRLLNISGESIFAAAKNHPLRTVKLNHAQSEFFINHPNYLYFFLKLIYERTEPDKIAEEYGLSNASLFKYLKKLDDLGLIVLGENNRAEFTGDYPMAVDTREYRQKDFEPLRRQLAKNFFSRVTAEPPESRNIKLSSFKLSEERIQSLNSELEKILFRYKRISEMEQIYGEEGLQQVTALAAVGRYSFISGITNL